MTVCFLLIATEIKQKTLARALKAEESIDEQNPVLIEEGALGLGWYWSENKQERQMTKIREKDRGVHQYIVGAFGTGKSKFLEFLIRQDVWKGNGFGVIDPSWRPS